jgi:hypothetical protein
MKIVMLLPLLALVCCTTDQPTGYVRSDNKFELTRAQCQGESKRATADYGLLGSGGEGPVPFFAGLADRSSKETATMNACMARNGYVMR